MSDTWSQLLEVPDDALDLARLAFVVARDEYPQLDVEASLARFDELAAQVKPTRLDPGGVSDLLFDTLGFRGNSDNYYDPRNSYLNDVLERRTGIPISLCIVYLEVGWRLGLDLEPVSFPGHFLVRSVADGGESFVDPFHGGIQQDRRTLMQRLDAMTGGQPLPPAELARAFAPCSRREVVARTLRNLKQIHLNARDWPRALRITDQLLHVNPADASQWRDRGHLYVRIGHLEAARADYRRYLELAPDAEDAPRVHEMLAAAASRSRPLN